MARALRNGRAAAVVGSAPIYCAIYTRKSTDEGLDRDFNSLDNQRERAEDYIRSQRHEGWEVLPERYDDGGFSGGSLERPALKRLLADIEAGSVQRIIVYKIDRLSRSLLDFARLAEFFEKHEASIVSVTQQLDTSTSMGRLTLNMLLSFAQFEREMVSDRTRDKMHAARRRGKWTGGMVPLGYDVAPEGGKLLVSNVEAEQVRAIFSLFLEKRSLVGTSQELNRRGWLRKSWTTRGGESREGKSWDRVTLRRVLTDPIYTGRMKLGNEIFPGEHDGIVPKGIFERVQDVLEGNGRDGNSGVRNRSGAILRGLLRCGACDSAMTPTYTKKAGRLYRYYICSKAQKRGHDTCPAKMVPATEVEEFVVDRIRAIGKDPNLCRETFRQALAHVTNQRRGLKVEAKRVAGEIGKAREDVDRLVGTVAEASNGARDALLAALEKTQRRLTMLENRTEEIRIQGESLKGCEVDEEEIVQTLEAFDPIWEVLHTPEKERILRLLVEKVNYDGGTENLTIAFRTTGIATLSNEIVVGGGIRTHSSGAEARTRNHQLRRGEGP